MPKIINHAGLTGQVGSVVFVKGAGETDNERMLAYFAEHADQFDIVDDPEPEQQTDPEADTEDDGPEDDGDPDDEPTGDDPYDVSVAKLRKLCGERDLPQAGSKADLQERLRASDNAGE